MAESKKLSIDELNQLYSQGDDADSEVFAEQRSNVLLVAGDHYSKKQSRYWNRIREFRELDNDQKLRLTKNHVHKIAKTYINNITSQSPGVTPVPNNPSELQDQKSAELNKSVWEYAKVQRELKTKTINEAKDFIEIGEVACKWFWDPMAGRFLGYEQEVDEMGQGVMDEMGQPKSSGRAVFSGDLVDERIYGFNLIRPAEAKTMKEAKWLCVRKMMDLKELKELVKGDEDKTKMIQSSADGTYFVFDGANSTYRKSDNQAMIKEFYFRPCYEWPNGYYYICTQEGILFEGELPFGVFPIVYEGFDEISTTPRHRSIIKQLRPYQIEINRSASKTAEHQITLGDDKVILQNGSKMTSGPNLPGIRSMSVTGNAPTILEGRTGAQYFEYTASQISEMYQVANVAEDSEAMETGADPFANLYKSIRNKKRFSMYSDRFANYLKNKCKLYLELAKHYFDENMLIPAIGRSEYINISEFKNIEPLSYQIKIEEVDDDIESMMGRHLSLNHILQYVGGNLEKDDIGKIIRNLPFANKEEIYSDFTLDYDTAVNIMLSLDRGDVPVPAKQDNGEYILKKLTARQKKADYRLLDQQIQANYDQMIEYYENMEAEKAAAMKAAQSEFIPASGAAIKVDYYIPDPNNKTRSIRATLPAESVDWLIKRLDEQGSSQANMAQQTTQTQSDMARMLLDKLNGQSAGMDSMGAQQQGGLQ